MGFMSIIQHKSLLVTLFVCDASIFGEMLSQVAIKTAEFDHPFVNISSSDPVAAPFILSLAWEYIIWWYMAAKCISTSDYGNIIRPW